MLWAFKGRKSHAASHLGPLDGQASPAEALEGPLSGPLVLRSRKAPPPADVRHGHPGGARGHRCQGWRQRLPGPSAPAVQKVRCCRQECGCQWPGPARHFYGETCPRLVQRSCATSHPFPRGAMVNLARPCRCALNCYAAVLLSLGTSGGSPLHDSPSGNPCMWPSGHCALMLRTFVARWLIPPRLQSIRSLSPRAALEPPAGPPGRRLHGRGRVPRHAGAVACCRRQLCRLGPPGLAGARMPVRAAAGRVVGHTLHSSASLMPSVEGCRCQQFQHGK